MGNTLHPETAVHLHVHVACVERLRSLHLKYAQFPLHMNYCDQLAKKV